MESREGISASKIFNPKTDAEKAVVQLREACNAANIECKVAVIGGTVPRGTIKGPFESMFKDGKLLEEVRAIIEPVIKARAECIKVVDFNNPHEKYGTIEILNKEGKHNESFAPWFANYVNDEADLASAKLIAELMKNPYMD